jgi:hypothetical protein
MAELLGCGKVRGLRDIPASALLNAQAKIEGTVQGMAFLPLVDGVFLTGDPLALVREGSAASVPVILGTNLDEWRLFQRYLDPGGRTIDDRQLLRRTQRSFGEAAGEIIECYRRERKAAHRGTVPGGAVAGGTVAGGGGGPDRRPGRIRPTEPAAQLAGRTCGCNLGGLHQRCQVARNWQSPVREQVFMRAGNRYS